MINWILAGLIVGICVLLILYATLPRLVWNWNHRRWFAKEETEPEPLKAYLDWVNWREKLEQRVTALEEQQEVFLLHIPNLWKEVVALKRFAGLADIPSPPTASPTTDCPSDVPERDYTPRLSPASWRSGLATTTGGPAEHPSQSAQGTDAPK